MLEPSLLKAEVGVGATSVFYRDMQRSDGHPLVVPIVVFVSARQATAFLSFTIAELLFLSEVLMIVFF